jgi:pyruvate/2-oxoglutarate dehydrogenase complex dihydrolipoamide dehydrogenase (E3) component
MQTSAPHIYAAGDCTGPHEIVHLAVQQGEIAAHNIVSPASPRQMDYRLLISVVFTEPQVAFVGLTEKEARSHRISYLAASYPFNDHGKSLIMEAKDGFVKLLADPRSGEILGGACVGPAGGELIHEIVAAMAKRMTVRELAVMPHYHPTLAEIWTYPAEELAEKVR